MLVGVWHGVLCIGKHFATQAKMSDLKEEGSRWRKQELGCRRHASRPHTRLAQFCGSLVRCQRMAIPARARPCTSRSCNPTQPQLAGRALLPPRGHGVAAAPP
eukprot:353364-Chlamydomonas_euryale.AAC.4